jgi:hypothetical protein
LPIAIPANDVNRSAAHDQHGTARSGSRA